MCTNYYRMKPNCCIVCIPLFLSQNISYINAACNSSPLRPQPLQSCRDWCIVAHNVVNQNLVIGCACSLLTVMDEGNVPFGLATYRRSGLARSFALIVVSVSRFLLSVVGYPFRVYLWRVKVDVINITLNL